MRRPAVHGVTAPEKAQISFGDRIAFGTGFLRLRERWSSPSVLPITPILLFPYNGIVPIRWFDILVDYWKSGIDQNDALALTLSDLDPLKWDSCLSGDPAYEAEYFAYLEKNYGEKREFDYNEAIRIIKGYFFSYRPLGKTRAYVLKRLRDEDAMKKLFEQTREGHAYRVHRKYLK